MEGIYPAGPVAVPENLTRPTPAYKRHAWIAMGVLTLFVALYVALSSWFVATAIRLLGAGTHAGLAGWLAAACAIFLSVFMIKALFFVQRGEANNGLEIKRADQPRLFAFLDRLADEAGAPRPHRVFLSPRVNAAVFYDLSILNLIFPSRKNLEIGLGLVNVLSLAEFKAVCAHEFGHFAQRSMAVGRWVYISQQIVGQIVARRDALDKFLQDVSHSDIRVAWIGWGMSAIVWSIRSLMDTVFRLVIIAQRALSREMEMQADLVAVSLTGSDALINALYRLDAADDAWNRTLDFCNGELTDKRMPEDAFAIHKRIIERMGQLHNDSGYGQPPAPAGDPAMHRVFQEEFAQPPKMWLTHPLNHEREANAKRVYVAGQGQASGAWDIFDDVPALKAQVTALIRGEAEAEPLASAQALATLDGQFDREHLNAAYRGMYWGRSAVRWAARPEELSGEVAASTLQATLDGLYPATLADDLARLQNLKRERNMLDSVHKGLLSAPGGRVRFRERDIPKKGIPQVVGELDREIEQIEYRLQEHDWRCRGAHRAAARLVGEGWEEYLDGLARILHFAEHCEADLRDAQGAAGHVVRIETAIRRVSSYGIERIMAASAQLHLVFERIAGFSDPANPDGTVGLDAVLAERLGVTDWPSLTGRHELSAPNRINIGQWLDVVDSWVGHWANALGRLRRTALDELLVAERKVAEAFRNRTPLPAAPAPSTAPKRYPVLLPGQERKREDRLGWWARFHTGDGMPATIARLLVAGGVVGLVLGAGGSIGDAQVVVYNGLGREITVKIGEQNPIGLQPFASTSVTIKPVRNLAVETRDTGGALIESFTEDTSGNFETYIYNVAAASPLLEWTAIYGTVSSVPERKISAARWRTTGATILFTEPPQSIQTRHGESGVRHVVSGLGDDPPGNLLEMSQSDAERKNEILQHARWDSPHSRHIVAWLEALSPLPENAAVLAERLTRDPGDIPALRAEQDATQGEAHRKLCERHEAAAAAAPANADRRYLADRCIGKRDERDRAFVEHHRRWPNNPWLANAASYSLLWGNRHREGVAAMESAMRREPAVASDLSIELARLRRLQEGRPNVLVADLGPSTKLLRNLIELEGGGPGPSPDLQAYLSLAQGKPDDAVRQARGTPYAQHVLRLAAASEGASPALIRQSLDQPNDPSLDTTSRWITAALAAREHRDPAPYLAPYLAKLDAGGGNEMVAIQLDFFQRLRNGDMAGASRQLDRLYPGPRGQSCATGVVFLGKNAPPAWRKEAKLLLFASERPYLR